MLESEPEKKRAKRKKGAKIRMKKNREKNSQLPIFLKWPTHYITLMG